MHRELTEAVRIFRHYGPIAGAALLRDTTAAFGLAMGLTGIVMGTVALVQAVAK